MRAIVINPYLKTIEEKDIKADYKGIRREIALFDPLLDTVKIDDAGHVMFCDDEGVSRPNQCFFRINGLDHWIGGTAIIIGSTLWGDEAPCKLALSEVELMISWPHRQPIFDRIEMQPETVREIFPGSGMMGVVIQSKTIFR